MDAEEMKKYEEAVRDVIGMHAIVLGRGGAGYVEFDAWLAAHDAEVRADAESDPAKDERLVRYIAMATPLGYQSALTVVQQMTLMIQAETEARRAGVVAEEPEWEYTRQAEANGWAGPAAYRDEAHASDGLMPGWRVVRRRKAGPWVPVKQEGADDDV